MTSSTRSESVCRDDCSDLACLENGRIINRPPSADSDGSVYSQLNLSSSFVAQPLHIRRVAARTHRAGIIRGELVHVLVNLNFRVVARHENRG